MKNFENICELLEYVSKSENIRDIHTSRKFSFDELEELRIDIVVKKKQRDFEIRL